MYIMTCLTMTFEIMKIVIDLVIKNILGVMAVV